MSRYHHGNLRRAVLDGALAAIAERGVGALSLRDVARRAGVSHAAPAHHFGDRAGVLTAIAIEGFEELTAATRTAGGDLVEGGLAYIRWALDHPAHYQVMFRPELLHDDDPDLVAVRSAGAEVLYDAVRRFGIDEPDVWPGVIAAWSWAHGFVGLWATANIAAPDPIALARQAEEAFARLASGPSRKF
jgi:AcrR family transcriptional regulator